jgi:hypothetical protein
MFRGRPLLLGITIALSSLFAGCGKLHGYRYHYEREFITIPQDWKVEKQAYVLRVRGGAHGYFVLLKELVAKPMTPQHFLKSREFRYYYKSTYPLQVSDLTLAAPVKQMIMSKSVLGDIRTSDRIDNIYFFPDCVVVASAILRNDGTAEGRRLRSEAMSMINGVAEDK